MSQNLKEMSIEELESLAIQLKEQEQKYLEEIKTAKVQVRDELLHRANIDYASQRLTAMGVSVTPARLNAILGAE